MSRLLCCVRARTADMGAALSHSQEGEPCEGGGLSAAPPTMADVIRERKKKAGGAGLGTLRRRLAAARRPRADLADRGCEHARFIRSVVASWRLAEVFVLCEELEAGAALRDLVTQAELAREPAAALHIDLVAAYRSRWWCDVELVGAGWAIPAHRAVLAARCTYFRDLLQRYPSGTWRVPLEGAGSTLSRDEMEACVLALYGGTQDTGGKCQRASDGDLDIISMDNSTACSSLRSRGRCSCRAGGGGGGAAAGGAAPRRAAALLGYSPDTLQRDLRYLLDSGEYADARLVFRLEGGCGAQYGFRTALELPVHRAVLAARSRFFRSVMSRRSSAAGGSATDCVCVDEKVLPRRFMRALLHAAYSDQVDLSLIGRGSSSPSASGAGTNNSGTAWPGGARSAGGGGAHATNTAMLEDAFQLYEIARFLEMPIVVQGCEDCIVEALTPESLPQVLRWASAPHASQWVLRQAMRYLRDEFPSIMSHAAAARLPPAALSDVLSSPFLQASEAQALRALLRWSAAHREPTVVWHTAHSVSRRGRGRGARRRELTDSASKEALASLVAHVRVEHLPADNELLQQAVRRGLLEAPRGPEAGRAADAWLGRGSWRPPRCFLPYLDELRALLLDQPPPDDVARARLKHRIPDTLYMVAAARNPSEGSPPPALGAESACVSPRTLALLRARVRELAQAPPAARALRLHAAAPLTVHRQIALRAVREMSLPDACAEMLLAEPDTDTDTDRDRDRDRGSSGSWESGPLMDAPPWPLDRQDCCRTAGSSGSLRCASAGSLRARAAQPPSLHIPLEASRAGTCRRELPSRPDSAQLRSSSAESSVRALRLSACVPDVAMAPNANTHLLTARDYCGGADYCGGGAGPPLQLDLGDGASHGSRALRAAHNAERARQHRDHSLGPCGGGAVRALGAEDSSHPGMRAYPGVAASAGGSPVPLARRPPGPPPPAYRADLPPYTAVRSRLSPSGSSSSGAAPGGGGGGGGGHAGPHAGLLDLPALTAARLRRDDARGGLARSPSASPRRRYRPAPTHDYRVEASYGGSASSSRGPSPSNYA